MINFFTRNLAPIKKSQQSYFVVFGSSWYNENIILFFFLVVSLMMGKTKEKTKMTGFCYLKFIVAVVIQLKIM